MSANIQKWYGDCTALSLDELLRLMSEIKSKPVEGMEGIARRRMLEGLIQSKRTRSLEEQIIEYAVKYELSYREWEGIANEIKEFFFNMKAVQP